MEVVALEGKLAMSHEIARLLNATIVAKQAYRDQVKAEIAQLKTDLLLKRQEVAHVRRYESVFSLVKKTVFDGILQGSSFKIISKKAGDSAANDLRKDIAIAGRFDGKDH